MKRTTLLVTLSSVAAAVAVVVACTRAATQNAGTALRAVHVAGAELVARDNSLHAVGLLTPKDEMRLSFKLGGVIEAIKVDEGQPVHAGQVLAMLKQAEVDASLEQALQSKQKAWRDLERGKALLADGVTTQESVQDLTTAYNVAAAAEAGTKFNAEHARIIATADGVVLHKSAAANEVVQAGQTILVVGDERRGWVVRIGLADRDIVRTHLGDDARIEFDAWPGQSFNGKVSNVASAADSGTGTFTVELQVQPGSARFVQGLVAKVSLDVSTPGSVSALPLQALVEANDKEAGVFILNPDRKTVRRVTLQIGQMTGARVEVLAGLPSGSQVVTDGAAFLENGEAVRVVGK
ncbi:MAG TPA: efflux RND transporter periplasmic adaptor subunit [Steroidobacteraceae bacterium]|jgi:RND family efflux transporter MFP subunit